MKHPLPSTIRLSTPLLLCTASSIRRDGLVRFRRLLPRLCISVMLCCLSLTTWLTIQNVASLMRQPSWASPCANSPNPTESYRQRNPHWRTPKYSQVTAKLRVDILSCSLGPPAVVAGSYRPNVSGRSQRVCVSLTMSTARNVSLCLVQVPWRLQSVWLNSALARLTEVLAWLLVDRT